MKVFYNSEFTGHYPIGTCAIVVAEDRKTASEILNQNLVSLGLDGDAQEIDMIEVDQSNPHSIVVLDGDY